jgi:hypothetical protein
VTAASAATPPTRWTRRRLLWLLAGVTLVLLVGLAILDGQLQDTGGPGIISFELAESTERATEILGQWGLSGRDTARASLWLDFLYLAAYGAFFSLAVRAVRDAAAKHGWTGFARPGTRIALLPIVAAVCDALEDVNLLWVIAGHANSPAPLLATAFASVKFVTIGISVLYLFAGLAALGVHWLRHRPALS